MAALERPAVVADRPRNVVVDSLLREVPKPAAALVKSAHNYLRRVQGGPLTTMIGGLLDKFLNAYRANLILDLQYQRAKQEAQILHYMLACAVAQNGGRLVISDETLQATDAHARITGQVAREGKDTALRLRREPLLARQVESEFEAFLDGIRERGWLPKPPTMRELAAGADRGLEPIYLPIFSLQEIYEVCQGCGKHPCTCKAVG